MVRGLGLITLWSRRPRESAQRHDKVAPSVFALIAVLLLATVSLPLAASGLSPAGPPVVWLAVPGLIAALVAGASLHVDFRYGEDDVDSLDLFEVALAPVIFALPPLLAVAVACGAKALAEAALGVQPVKAAFNVASWGAAAGFGTLVLGLLEAQRRPEPLPLVLLGVAMVGVLVVNNATFIALLCLTQHQNVRQTIHVLRPAMLPGWVVGGGVALGFGLVLTAAYIGEPATAWLFLVPLVALHWAARGYARSRAELSRVEGLHRATAALARPVSLEQAIEGFLDEVRTSFRAELAQLVLVGAGERDPHPVLVQSRGDGQAPPAEVVEWMGELGCATRLVDPDHAVAGRYLREGWREVLVTPLRTGAGARGALIVGNPDGGFAVDGGDLPVLTALGRELATALERENAQRLLHRSEARFRALVQRSADSVVVLNREGIVTEVIASSRSPQALAPQLDVGQHAADPAHPDDHHGVIELLDGVLSGVGRAGTVTWRARAGDGSWLYLETVATNLLDDPAVDGVVLNSRDVSERERAAATVARQTTVLGAIARQRSLADVVALVADTVDAQLPGARYTVALAREPLGASAVLGDSLPGDFIDSIVHEVQQGRSTVAAPDAGGRVLMLDDIARVERLRRSRSEADVAAVCAVELHTSAGAAALGTAIVHFPRPRPFGPSDWHVVRSAVQLTQIAIERASAEARLLHQATHDPLTGLPNRRLFLDRAAQALRRLGRSGRTASVLFVDLDGFKAVNDGLGHDAGDHLLISLAARIQEVMRPADTVARFGGDEFTILCEDIDEPHEVAAIATRVREALAPPVSHEGHDISITASIGIASTSDPRADPLKLVERADAAMYRSKQAGGNQHQIDDRFRRGQERRFSATPAGFRDALNRDELLVYYQPTVDLNSGRVTGAEALVRWDHPEHGILAPSEFIPLAERTGLIVPMGALVLREACRQAEKWRQRDETFVMSVNVSAHQLNASDFTGTLSSALADAGVPPGSLELELTESVLMESVERSMTVLHELKDLGVELAIDDFGTGYSSLSYLKHFPVDVIKIDRSFVSGLRDDPDDRAIIAAVVDLSRHLGVTAVAEGVETRSQLQVLQHLGCGRAQGYFFSRPVPPQRFTKGPFNVSPLAPG